MNFKKRHKRALTMAKNIALTLLGTMLLSFGNAVFIIPFNLVCGGVTGFSIALSGIIKSDFLSTEELIAIFSWSLFFAGLFILGRAFALKTLLSTLLYPIGISLFSRLTSPNVLGGLFVFESEKYGEISLLLAAVFGAIFIGTGCALTFLGGGSTGGADIIAFSICKFFRRLKSSYVIFALDAAVIIFGMLTLKSLTLTLLGILSAFITAIVIDKLFLGESGAFVAQIVSDKSGEISEEIIKNLRRGTTFFDVTGGYSKNCKKMLMVSFKKEQYLELIRLIDRIDPRAFVTVHRAHEVRGEGFSK